MAEIYSQEDYLIGITGRRKNLLEEICARDKDKLFYQVCDIIDTQTAISSVGGTRDSGITPIYNASKVYQINYMEGIRQKATKSPYSIYTTYTTDIRLGFVDTVTAKGEGLFWFQKMEICNYPVSSIAIAIYMSDVMIDTL